MNCGHCGIELRKDSLRRHIKTKYQKEEPNGMCVLTLKTQSSWCPKIISIKAIHIMFKKKLHSGTDPCLSCKSDFCMNCMSMCAKSGLKNVLCRHLGQVVAANTSFPEPVVRLDEILDSLGPDDKSFDKILKVKTIEKCKELNSTSLKSNITPVVTMDAETFTYLSDYHGKKHYSARLKRFIVMFTK